MDQAKMIREDLATLRVTPEWIVCDPSMKASRHEQGLAKSVFEVYHDILHDVVPLRLGAAGRSARVSRPQRWLDALSIAEDGWPWWSATTACPHLIRTLPEVPWDENDPEVEDEESENHAYEGVGRFFEARPHKPRVKEEDPLRHLEPLSRQEALRQMRRYVPSRLPRYYPGAITGFGTGPRGTKVRP